MLFHVNARKMERKMRIFVVVNNLIYYGID